MPNKIHSGKKSNLIEYAREVLLIESRALERVRERIGASTKNAVELMRQCVERQRKIITTGMGKSGHIAAKVAATLTSTGSPAVYLDCANAFHGDLGIVSQGDCVLLFSYSGSTEEILRLLPLIKRQNTTIIALSGNSQSPLASAADVWLDVSVEAEACPHNLAPTASTTAMLALGDALAMTLMQARGVTREVFAQLHPGGAIGRTLLLKVSELMRTGEKLATVPETASVLDALEAMRRARSGASVIISARSRLAGIFTHGDFARHYQKDPNIGAKPVATVMTPRPITINHDALAVEALKIFETHQIDDLVVIDSKRRPVGIVDAQDLTKYHLI